jgi:hypothetical protein
MQGRFVDRVQAGVGVGAQLGLANKTVTITYFMFYCKEFYNLLGEVIFFGFFMDARSST